MKRIATYVIAASLLAAPAAFASEHKLGKHYDSFSEQLKLNAEQTSCVADSLGEMKKKTRKEFFKFSNPQLETALAQVPEGANVSDVEKVESMDRLLSAFLGLKVLSIGAMEIDKWRPISKSLIATKKKMIEVCQGHFDADIVAIFDLKEAAE